MHPRLPYRVPAVLTPLGPKVRDRRFAMTAGIVAAAGAIALVGGARQTALVPAADPQRAVRDPRTDVLADPPPAVEDGALRIPPPPIGALPFEIGMTRPYRTSGPKLVYSKEAIAAQTSGVALAWCVVEIDGSLSNCEITRSVAHMDDQVLEYLRGSRYWCVIFEGHCERVWSPISVRVVADL